MEEKIKSLNRIIKKLSPEAQIEVIEYAEKLLKKNTPKKKMKLDWVGGLKEYREQFTSLELQKKSLEWWSE